MTMIYLVVLVMVSTVQAGDCPVSCTCNDVPRYELQTDDIFASVLCKTGDNITQNLPARTYKLQITDVQLNLNVLLDDLADDFDYLPYLSDLEFSNCNFLNVTDVSFGEDRVRTLKIIRCQVSSLPAVNVTSLKILDLSDNKFEVINFNPFRTLLNLEVLNLSANAIDALHPDVFVGLDSLKCLDLSDNNLTVLNDTVLVPVVNLQHLNLSNNRLEVLNEACFSSLLHLQQLDVSWNRLARVLPGNLELPSLARLLLAGNPGLGRSRKPTLLVGTGRKLQTVDASRTGLKQVPAALTHSIRTLRLAGNSIRSVSCGDLDSYPLLQLLDFMSNNLERIDDDALGRLDSLAILYLTDNKLKSIPRSLPEKLKVLHLENNDIEQILVLDLQGLPQIEVLLLNNNRIGAIEAGAFAQLGSLVALDLSRNPIRIMPAGILSGPTRLQVLRLSGLTVVPPAKEVAFPLTTPDYLITLDLSNSPGLSHQLLADTAALVAARQLQELNLSNTGLEHIRSDLLHFLQQLRVLHLTENPINCTDLQWLGSWMRKQDEPEYRSVTCASPAELWGTPLMDLQDAETEVIHINESENSSDVKEGLRNEKSGNNETTSIHPPFVSLQRPTAMLDPDALTTITLHDTGAALQKTNTSENKYVGNKTNVKEGRRSNYFAYTFSRNVSKDNKEVNLGVTQAESIKENTTNYPNEIGDVNVTIPTAQMSLYGGDAKTGLAHPGMLILVIGVLAATAALALLTTRFTKRRNSRRMSDIEVSSIPSVSELW